MPVVNVQDDGEKPGRHGVGFNGCAGRAAHLLSQQEVNIALRVTMKSRRTVHQ